jgi:RNA recognition motif-containing protein
VIKDRISRKGKGFGYIKFKSFKSFKKAIEAAEFSFGGRNIRVTQAQYTKEMRNKD